MLVKSTRVTKVKSHYPVSKPTVQIPVVLRLWLASYGKRSLKFTKPEKQVRMKSRLSKTIGLRNLKHLSLTLYNCELKKFC